MSTNEKVNVSSEVSKSKQKRADRKKKNEQVKREGLIGAIIGILAIVLIIGAICYSIAAAIIRQSAIVEPNAEFGKYITDAGMVQGVKASSIITLPSDYKNITVPKSEVEYTDDMFEEEMVRQLENHKILDNAADIEIKDGDKVNLDYVGSIDGVEFEGGSTDGAGSDLEIGSGTFIPGFEDQLIGHKTGENFDIEVTFPDDYGSEDLAGKDAVFNITLNGVYKLGEFTDSFVAENLKGTGATTVAEFRAKLEKDQYDSGLEHYVANYIQDNSAISKYPSKYLKQLMALRMYTDEQSYEYMNQMYQSMGYGSVSFEDYFGASQADYQASIDESCKEECKGILAIQAIAEKEGITATDDDVKAFVEGMYGEGSYENIAETYGMPYLKQEALQSNVYKMLQDNATVK